MTHTFDDEYWARVWQSDRAAAMGSSEPNPQLQHEVGTLAPGTALDAGCGAGAEAIWLAAHGWQVTGADIAAAALDRAAERADAAGVGARTHWVRADLSTWEPNERYDLVTTHYAHPAIPQLDFYERIASWVAPGGTLVVVGHLHREHAGDTVGTGHDHARHAHGDRDGRGHGQAAGHRHADDGHGDGPPAAASATAADITARLDPATWQVVTAREPHRTVTGPGGHEVTLHEVVVRATRRP